MSTKKVVTKIKVSNKKGPKKVVKKNRPTKEGEFLKQSPVLNDSLAHGYTPAQNLEIADKKKKLVMYIGVAVIMVAIIVVWISNLQKILKPNPLSVTAENSSSEDFSKMQQSLKDSINQFKEGVDQLKELSNNSSTPTEVITPLITPTTVVNPEITTTKLPNTLPK